MSDAVLTPEMIEAMNIEIAKFPAGRQRSASLSCLRIAQEMGKGFVTTAQMDAIAAHLDLEPIEIYEVATFYTMCKREPTGKYNLCVCTNLSCSLSGSQAIVDHLKKRLNVSAFDEITPDGKFSIEEVECLGACVEAPVLQLGDHYHANLTPEKIDALIDELEKADA